MFHGGTGKTKPKWWGTALINSDPITKYTYQFELDFRLAQSGQLHEGVCFFVTVNPDKSLNGYFFNVNNHKKTNTYYACRLWKFTHYTLDQSFSSGINDSTHMWCYPASTRPGWTVGKTSTSGSDSFTCLAAWDGTATAKYHVEASNGHILIKRDNTTVANVSDNTYTEGTYGFWGNNCEQPDSMYLCDINLISKNKYTLIDLLNDTVWKTPYPNLIVNIDNSTEDIELDTDAVTKLNDHNVHFLNVKHEECEANIQDILSQINNRGKFLNINNYSIYTQEIISYLTNLF